MEEELDLGPANELRKAVFQQVVRGERTAAARAVYEHLRVIQEGPGASQTDCKDGCAYCCSLPVMITVAEGEVLAEAIRTSPRRDELIERLRADHARLAGRSLDELALLGRPCPLLDGRAGEGSCAVYEARPLACRSHSSYDVEICRAHYRDPAKERTTPARPLDFMTQLVTQSGLAGPLQKAFELRALLLELLTGQKRKDLRPASMDVTFKPARAQRRRLGRG